MSVFSSSSRHNNLINSDGSRNVHCYVCNEFICTTFLKVNRSLCAICERAENGQPIPEEALKAYLVGKMNKANVSMLVLEDPPPTEQTRKFSFKTMGSSIMKALGLTKPAAVPVESQNIANKRRRKRLFENLDKLNQTDSQK